MIADESTGKRREIEVRLPNDEPIHISVKDTTSIGKLRASVSKAKGIDLTSHQILLNGAVLQDEQTIKMLELEDEDHFDFMLKQIGGAADEEDGTKRHTVTVRFGGAEPDLTIKLKYSTQMAKLYAAVAKHRGVNVDTFKLLFEDHVVQPHDTPKMLEMEDEEQLDYQMAQQGGAVSL